MIRLYHGSNTVIEMIDLSQEADNAVFFSFRGRGSSVKESGGLSWINGTC